MKDRKIIFFVVLNCFLFVNIFASDIRVLSYDRYGKKQTALLNAIIDKYNALEIKDYDSIKWNMSTSIEKIIVALDFFVKNYSTSELINKVYFALGDMHFISAICYFKKYNIKDYDFLKKIKQALNFYEKALSHRTSNFVRQNILYRIIEIYFSLRDFGKTLQLSKNYSDNYPETYLIIDTLYMLTINYVNLNDGQGFISLEKWRELKNVLKNINTVDIDKKNLQKVCLSLGIIHFILEEYEDSIENLKKVNSIDAQFYLGKVYEQVEKYILAIGEYKSLILKAPNSKYEKFIRFSIGNSYYKMGKYQESLDTFMNYQGKYPNDEYLPFVNYKIGCNYFYMGNFSKAVEFFDKVKFFKGAKVDTNINEKELELVSFNSSYLKAYSYYVNKQYEQASVAFLNCYTAFQKSFLSEKIIFMAAWCLYNIKDYANSEKLILEYLNKIYSLKGTNEIDEKYAIYLNYLLANIQIKLNKKEEALQNYQKIIDKVVSSKISALYELRDNAILMMLKIHYDDKNFIKIATEFHYVLKSVIPKIERKPIRVEIYLIVADACFRMKYFKEAKILYKNMSIECRNDDVSYSKVLDGLAWCEYEQGNYVMAEKYRNVINDIIKYTDKNLDDLKLENFYELGNINFNQKKYSKAIENYEKYLKMSKNLELLPEVLYRLGICYYREEYYSLAIERWNEIIEKYPNYKSNLFVSYKIADTYYKSGKYIEAIKVYEYIFSHFDHNDTRVIEAKLRIGQSYYNAKEYDKALESFKNFIVIYPDEEKTEEVIELIENTLYKKQEKEAIFRGKTKVEIHIAKDFETNLLDFIQKNPGKYITMEIIYKIALNYFRESDYNNALIWYDRFFKLGNYSEFDKEKVLSSQYNMAEIYYFLKNYELAIQSYEAIIQSFKDSEYYEKAFIRIGTGYLNIKDYKRAIQKYTEMLENIPDTEYKSLINYNLGICYRELKDLKHSNEYFLRYYDLNKDNITSELIKLMIDIGDSYLGIREFSLADSVYRTIFDKLNGEQKIYVQYKIAEGYEKSFKTREAIEEYSNLLPLEPSENKIRLTGLLKLAELYKNNNMNKEAFDTYKIVYNTTDNEKWKKSIEYNMNEIKNLLE